MGGRKAGRQMTGTEKQLNELFGAGDHVIGAIVMWSLSGVRVTRDEFRSELEGIGLGSAMPRDPRPNKALATAVGSVKAPQSLFPRRLSRDAWAVIRENEIDGVMQHEHVLTIALDDGTAKIAAISVLHDDVAQTYATKIVARYCEVRRFVDTADVSTVMCSALRGTDVRAGMGAVSLRDRSGGVYFVPGPQVGVVKALKRVVERHSTSHVTTLVLHGNADNLAEAAKVAGETFTAQLNDLRCGLEAFAAELQDAGKEATDRQIDTRVNHLQVLSDRVGLWSDVLGDVTAELQGKIEEAKRQVAGMLGLDDDTAGPIAP